MSTTTLVVILVIVAAFAISFFLPRKRPKPQSPPSDVSDRERFRAIKRDLEGK